MQRGTGGDWLFDLGNTRLKLAPLSRDGQVGEVQARAHDAPDWQARLPSGDTAWVCDVASSTLSLELLQELATRFRRVSIARTSATFAGVRVAYAQPGRMGVDRFLALLGARSLGAGPWLVVGVGTALTIDLLAADGRHVGGRIAPSPEVMRAALHARATHLPVDGGHYAEFATDTRDALASGCEGAAIALVERSLAQARKALGADAMPLLHGGGAPALASAVDGARVERALVLQGLATWARAGARRG
ncbi:MAG TPA: type III pantothenate kinase [Xanthomonadaceae bacterium]|nr:type III pantothenate kinase [Xanthomonadaceae bacterium]